MNLDPQIEKIVNSYYENGAKKLHNLVDKVLKKLGFVDIEKSDFYSFANEIFVQEVLECYDGRQNFEGFLYCCLYKKFCSEMTKLHRNKRCTKIKIKVIDENGNEMIKNKIVSDICIDAPLKDCENMTVGDLIADKFDVHKEAFEWEEEGLSNKMSQYLSRLSSLQKKVLRLLSVGYAASEIKKELHITNKQYNDCLMAIRSYRNTSILF